MAKVRQDAWSHEDDLLLAETVLRHVREGSTQLNAFEEVGDKLNRTSAACGFRWNAEVRMKYDRAMDLAKRQRKEKKRRIKKQSTQSKQIIPINNNEQYVVNEDIQQTEINKQDSSITIDDVLIFLSTLKEKSNHSNETINTLAHTEEENDQLREHIGQLEKQLDKTKQQLTSIQEDYQAFIEIMDRARKMTILDSEHTTKSPAFKMDKNGNLEQISQGLNP